jgi:hypothetical protein
MLQAIERAIEAGVPVVWVGDFPERADGLVDPEARDAMVSSLVESLRSTVAIATSVEEIPAAISNAGVTPSLSPVDSAGLQVSVEHREVSNGDVYFLFNESYEERTDQLRIEGAFGEALMLDPETGKPVATHLEGDVVTVTLPGARGAVLWVKPPVGN